MIPPEIHPQEQERLQSLSSLRVMDTAAEKIFDDLAELASILCDTPVALVSLVDEDRQWFKAKHGIELSETARNISFCAHAILQEDLFVVENASQDARFVNNPLVTDGSKIQFYAGTVLKDANNLPLGSLCVIDSAPRKLTPQQAKALRIIGKQVESQLLIRKKNMQLMRVNQLSQEILSLVAHDLKGAFTIVLGSSALMSRKLRGFKEKDGIMRIGNRLVSAATDVYELLDELLQWTRLQMNDQGIETTEVDIADLVNSTMKVFEESARIKGVELCADVQPCVVKINADVTKTILRNFISNSLKHTPAGKKVAITLEINGSEAVIAVHDEGPGVPEAMKPHLFKAIQEGAQDDYAQPPSHGVGLYLCNNIATRQKSRIWLDDTVAQGCRMCLALPKPDVTH